MMCKEVNTCVPPRLQFIQNPGFHPENRGSVRLKTPTLPPLFTVCLRIEFIMGYSKKIRFNTKAEKKDGTCAIYLVITIDREVKRFHLGIYWPVEKCSQLTGIISPRSKKDRDWEDYQIILNDAMAKANEIFKYCRLNNKQVSMPLFLKKWTSNIPKESFIEYYKLKNKQRLIIRNSSVPPISRLSLHSALF